jgi:hypothetical protein
MAKRKKYKTTNMNVLDKYRNKEQVFAIINQPNIIDYKRDIHIFICDANAKFQFQRTLYTFSDNRNSIGYRTSVTFII